MEQFNITKSLSYLNPDLVSMVARRCSDQGYDDFPKEMYQESISESTRELAKDYRILNRSYTYTNQETGVRRLHIPSFMNEHRVYIDNIEYDKVNQPEFDNDKDNIYYIQTRSNGIFFNYSGIEAGQKVVILYTADVDLPDYDIEETTPLLAGKFKKELLARAVIYICKLGMGKFKGDRLEKYTRLYRIYKRDTEKDVFNERDDNWTTIKLFQFP